jgi:membrane protein
VIQLLRRFRSISAGFRGEALALRAGNLTFITITSVVPVVAVLFSLLHAVHADQVDPFVMRFLEAVLSPGGRSQSEATVRKFLIAANSRAAGGLSLAFLLVSSGMMVRHLDAALNEVWAVRQKRPFVITLSLYAGIFLLAPLMIALTLLGTDGLKRLILWLEMPFSAQAIWLGTLAVVVLVFSLLYKLAPHAPVPWRSALKGGLVAGTAWELARQGYGSLATIFFSANPLYGSLGIAPLFLMWIYAAWYIVLAGARLAYAFEHADFHQEFRHITEHPRSQEILATAILEQIARTPPGSNGIQTARTIAKALNLPQQRIIDLVAMLSDAGLVARLGKQTIVLGRPADRISVADVSEAVGGGARLLTLERERVSGQFEHLANVFRDADELSVRKIDDISIASLVAEEATNGKT